MHSVKLAVADGDPISLRRCVDELSGKRGIHIVACTADGAELIEAVRETHPDVVVTGLTLKHVDGFGVLEAIRMMSGSRPISLVLSKMNTDCVIDLATKLGADDYLVKPINGGFCTGESASWPTFGARTRRNPPMPICARSPPRCGTWVFRPP